MKIHCIYNGPFTLKYNPKHLIYNTHTAGYQCAVCTKLSSLLTVWIQSLLKSTRHLDIFFIIILACLCRCYKTAVDMVTAEKLNSYSCCLPKSLLKKSNYINIWQLSISHAVMCQVLFSACNVHQSIPLAYSRSKSGSAAISLQCVSLSFYSSIPLSLPYPSISHLTESQPAVKTSGVERGWEAKRERERDSQRG